jgi:hypothetical protein
MIPDGAHDASCSWCVCVLMSKKTRHLFQINIWCYNGKKGSPVYVAPACTEFGEGSDYFGSYVRSLSLHFCKRLFPGLEPMTSWCYNGIIVF